MSRIVLMFTSLVTLFCLVTGATAQDYRVQPGDILRVEVIEDPSLNRTVLVSPDGRIALPGAGATRAAGLTIEQIRSALTDRLMPNFTVQPTVFVGIEQLAPVIPEIPLPPEPDPVVAIFVVGEANNVGRIELVPGTNLLQAFAQFGGFTNFAATQRIQLRRDNKIYTINYEAILNGTSTNGAVTLAEGDVIIVPQRTLFE